MMQFGLSKSIPNTQKKEEAVKTGVFHLNKNPITINWG